MSSELRKTLVLQALGAAVFNLLLNGGIAWLSFRGAVALPLWARGPCVAFDTIGTSLFLPLVTCLIMTPLVRRGARAAGDGGAARGWTRATRPFLRRLPRNFALRGLAVGLVSAALVAPAALALLSLAGVVAMNGGGIVVWKAVYSGVLAALVTPIFALGALADVAESAALAPAT